MVLNDHYDERGQLWRTSIGTTWNHYDVPGVFLRTIFHYDLHRDIYAIDAALNSFGEYKTFDAEQPIDEKNFTPERLRQQRLR